MTMQASYCLDALTSVESTSLDATPPIGPTATGGGPQSMAENSPVKNCAPYRQPSTRKHCLMNVRPNALRMFCLSGQRRISPRRFWRCSTAQIRKTVTGWQRRESTGAKGAAPERNERHPSHKAAGAKVGSAAVACGRGEAHAAAFSGDPKTRAQGDAPKQSNRPPRHAWRGPVGALAAGMLTATAAGGSSGAVDIVFATL